MVLLSVSLLFLFVNASLIAGNSVYATRWSLGRKLALGCLLAVLGQFTIHAFLVALPNVVMSIVPVDPIFAAVMSGLLAAGWMGWGLHLAYHTAYHRLGGERHAG